MQQDLGRRMLQPSIHHASRQGLCEPGCTQGEASWGSADPKLCAALMQQEQLLLLEHTHEHTHTHKKEGFTGKLQGDQ